MEGKERTSCVNSARPKPAHVTTPVALLLLQHHLITNVLSVSNILSKLALPHTRLTTLAHDAIGKLDEPAPAGQIVIVAAFRSSTASMAFD
jgi:hypothetical protein